MKIEILVQGDPDSKPFTKKFNYEKLDDLIFFKTTQIIKNRLSNNLRLNINETLEFYVAFIIISLNENKTINEIQKYIPKLLSSYQVMIGVPESLRKLIFTIIKNENNTKTISITTPIPVNQYFLHNQDTGTVR
ncbi:urease subunit gamma [Nitrosopumilus sp. S4]